MRRLASFTCGITQAIDAMIAASQIVVGLSRLAGRAGSSACLSATGGRFVNDSHKLISPLRFHETGVALARNTMQLLSYSHKANQIRRLVRGTSEKVALWNLSAEACHIC